MSEQTLQNLFINFRTLEGKDHKQLQGRGLSLSIGKTILEKMGGSVNVTSVQGKGSTFTMNFKCMSLKEAPL